MAVTQFVNPIPLEEYSERFKEHFVMERRNGVLMLRAHTQGKSVLWGPEIHRAIPQVLQEIGADPENEVLIFTGTGNYWIAHTAVSGVDTDFDEEKNREWGSYNIQYLDGTKLQENLIFDLQIPTIGAINGPGFHVEMLLMCDITICTDDSVISDAHYLNGMVPGDGINCALLELLGPKRANYAMLMGQVIDAQKALDWGLVNEVVPKDKIYERAWEIGNELMKADRIMRRLTTQVLRKSWKTRIVNDLHFSFAHEMFAYNVGHITHDDIFKASTEKGGIKIDKR